MNASIDESDRAPAPARRKTASSFALADLLAPIRAFRWRYLPLLMVYFAYGALGLIDVTRDMWIKESLTLDPAQLAEIGVWLNLPWADRRFLRGWVGTARVVGAEHAAAHDGCWEHPLVRDTAGCRGC